MDGGQGTEEDQVDGGQGTEEDQVDGGQGTEEDQVDGGQGTEEDQVDGGQGTEEDQVDGGQGTEEDQVDGGQGTEEDQVDEDQVDGGQATDEGIDAGISDGGDGGEQTWTDEYGITWTSIPAGTFEMGCSVDDDSCLSYENPRHTVNVSAFAIMTTEVTQAQYLLVTGENPSNHTDCENCPVESLSWFAAKDFCESVGGRLPSEAEWEYAARAGTSTKYYCGNDVSCVDDIAWHLLNSEVDDHNVTHEVALKTPNDFGLYDILGNVQEWVEDCWHDNYDGAPDTGGVWQGGDCGARSPRGGSYINSPLSSLRASARDQYYVPGYWERYLGLRCAMDLGDLHE